MLRQHCLRCQCTQLRFSKVIIVWAPKSVIEFSECYGTRVTTRKTLQSDVESWKNGKQLTLVGIVRLHSPPTLMSLLCRRAADVKNDLVEWSEVTLADRTSGSASLTLCFWNHSYSQTIYLSLSFPSPNLNCTTEALKRKVVQRFGPVIYCITDSHMALTLSAVLSADTTQIAETVFQFPISICKDTHKNVNKRFISIFFFVVPRVHTE